MHMVMTSDETQTEMFSDWPLPDAKHVTADTWQSSEYHVVVDIKRRVSLETCGQTKTVPQKIHGQTRLEMSSILDLKRPTE